MKTPKGLGRLFVAITALSLLIMTGGWALSAPAPSPSPGPSSDVAALRAATISPSADRPIALFERQSSEPREPEKTAPQPHVLASIEHSMPITARPGGGGVVGEMPVGSRYYDTPHKAWVLERTEDGRFGKVTVPYSGTQTTGWIRLAGMELSNTEYSVTADLSQHLIEVKRFDKTIMRFPAATGASASPTPPGRYFVTDRVAIEGGGYLGTFAFGLSGIQPNLPAGWTGGNQLAIHGTDTPSTIGTSASAGCLRVSEGALDRLKPVLKLGTPVTIQP